MSDMSPPRWWTPPVDRAEVKKLMERTNGRAAGSYGLWLLLTVGMGWLSAWVFTAGSPWCILAFFLYGTLFSSANARWHESMHGTPFKTPVLNDIAFFLAAAMEYKDMVSARWSHLTHHSHTIILAKDLEVLAPRPVRLGIILLDYFYIHYAVLSFWYLILHSLGIPSKGAARVVPKGKYLSMFWASRAVLAMHAAAIVLAIVLRSWLPILLFTVPRIYGGLVPWLFVVTQHSGLAQDVWDHRLNTRTLRVNPVLSFLYMHMENHIEHHLFPNVPFHKLPRLHTMVEPWLPGTYRGLLDAYREMWPALLRQRKDPGHYIRRELPVRP
jgi:fatty acid desaturase